MHPPYGAILCLLVLPAAVSSQPATTPEQAVRNVLEQQRSAWNRGDLAAFMQTYWNSPRLTFFSGDTIATGWQATLERYRRKYQANGAHMGQLSFTAQDVQLLSESAALVTARWHLLMPNGEKREGLTTVLVRRIQGAWKIVHDHSS